MTGREALETLLARIADSFDGTVYVSDEELGCWPRSPVATLKAIGLLRRVSPAKSAKCDGCERGCHMPVEVLVDAEPMAFVFCDKSEDINRVEIPLKRVTRWQSSGRAVASFLAKNLGLREPGTEANQGKLWSVGVLRDRRSAQLELAGETALTLQISGHVLPLADVVTLTGKSLKIARHSLIECVNNPISGGGTVKSAAERAERIAKMAREKGVKATAGAFGISPSRVKQITAGHRRRTAALQ